MKKDRERASITVEAALFLPLFLMAFLTIYNLVYFARAQMLMQYAADQAVKQVAQYSYILEKTGILDSLDNMTTKNEKFEQDMDSIRKNLETQDCGCSRPSGNCDRTGPGRGPAVPRELSPGILTKKENSYGNFPCH